VKKREVEIKRGEKRMQGEPSFAVWAGEENERESESKKKGERKRQRDF